MSLARDMLRALVAELRRDPATRADLVAVLLEGAKEKAPVAIDDVARARARRALARAGVVLPRSEEDAEDRGTRGRRP